MNGMSPRKIRVYILLSLANKYPRILEQCFIITLNVSHCILLLYPVVLHCTALPNTFPWTHPSKQFSDHSIPLPVFLLGAEVAVRHQVDFVLKAQHLGHLVDEVHSEALKAVVALAHDVVPLQHCERPFLGRASWLRISYRQATDQLQAGYASVAGRLRTSYRQVSHHIEAGYASDTGMWRVSYRQLTHKLQAAHASVTGRWPVSYRQVTHRLQTGFASVAGRLHISYRQLTHRLQAGDVSVTDRLCTSYKQVTYQLQAAYASVTGK